MPRRFFQAMRYIPQLRCRSTRAIQIAFTSTNFFSTCPSYFPNMEDISLRFLLQFWPQSMPICPAKRWHVWLDQEERTNSFRGNRTSVGCERNRYKYCYVIWCMLIPKGKIYPLVSWGKFLAQNIINFIMVDLWIYKSQWCFSLDFSSHLFWESWNL